MPIDYNDFCRVQTLLARTGYSRREISKELGLSRGTVDNIYRGKHRFCFKNPEELKHEATDAMGGLVYPRLNSSMKEKCPECGALVKMPCFACQIRNRVSVNLASKRVQGVTGPNPLDETDTHDPYDYSNLPDTPKGTYDELEEE